MVGEVVTASMLNAHVRDNFNYLFNDIHQIQSQVLGTAQAFVTFSSIPSTWRHLLLAMSIRFSGTSTGANVQVRLNQEATSVYQCPLEAANALTTQWGIGTAVGVSSDSQMNSILMLIADYAAVKRHSFTSIYGGYTVAVGGGLGNVTGGRHINSEAITTVDVFGALSVDAGSAVTLYGMS